MKNLVLNIKRITLIVFLLFSLVVKSQDLKDFYYPREQTLTFVQPEIDIKEFREIFVFEGIMDEVNVLTKTIISNTGIMSKITYGIDISENNITIVSEYSRNKFNKVRIQRYNVGKVILKMPKKGKATSWRDSNDKYNYSNYTAELSNILVNGELKEAIKVKIVPVEDGKILSSFTDIHYYAKGIGLCLIETSSKKIFRKLVKCDNKNIDIAIPNDSRQQIPHETTVKNNCPMASTHLLKDSEVRHFSKEKLRLMRNEIFARHGYIFKAKDLQEYFSKQDWYKPLHNNVDDKLTDIDKNNIKLINKYENK